MGERCHTSLRSMGPAPLNLKPCSPLLMPPRKNLSKRRRSLRSQPIFTHPSTTNNMGPKAHVLIRA